MPVPDNHESYRSDKHKQRRQTHTILTDTRCSVVRQTQAKETDTYNIDKHML